MSKKVLKPTSKRTTPKRSHRHAFALNNEEEKVFMRYIEKYRIQNQSKFIRETIIMAIIRQFEEDHPTLF